MCLIEGTLQMSVFDQNMVAKYLEAKCYKHKTIVV